MRNIAIVTTDHAKRYVGQFVKHFAHKLPAELAEDGLSGQVEFSAGVCRLGAADVVLSLELDGPDDAMERLRDVVARHLSRFAFREELRIEWREVADN
jgi:hypothetical protein